MWWESKNDAGVGCHKFHGASCHKLCVCVCAIGILWGLDWRKIDVIASTLWNFLDSAEILYANKSIADGQACKV